MIFYIVLAELIPESWRQILQENHTIIVENLRSDAVVPVLFSQKVLNFHQKQDLDALPTEYRKADYLISNVLRKTTTAKFQLFIQVCVHQPHLRPEFYALLCAFTSICIILMQRFIFRMAVPCFELGLHFVKDFTSVMLFESFHSCRSTCWFAYNVNLK